MDVSIIYVNFRTTELVIDSIRSVQKHTRGISYEIIVVDNHSEDNSLDRLPTLFPEVRLIRLSENIGFGRANNRGMEIATGKCIFFLNPDTLLRNDAITLLFRYLEEHPETGACGGNLFDEEGKPTTSYSLHFPSVWQEFLSIFYLSPSLFKKGGADYFNHTGKPQQVASIIGADLMVKQDVLQRTGVYDPAFFLNYEETELCYRIQKAGYKIMSVPEAEITHFEGRAVYIKESRLFFLYEGQYIYFYKKGGWKEAKRIYRVTQWKNNLRIFQFILLNNKRRLSYWRMKKATNRKAFRTFKEKQL